MNKILIAAGTTLNHITDRWNSGPITNHEQALYSAAQELFSACAHSVSGRPLTLRLTAFVTALGACKTSSLKV